MHPSWCSGGGKDQIIVFHLLGMTPCLRHQKWCPHPSSKLGDVWLGTLCSSGHHASVCTQWACQRTQWLLSSRDGFGHFWSVRVILAFFADPRWFLPTEEFLNLGVQHGWASQILNFGLWPICVITLCHFVCPGQQLGVIGLNAQTVLKGYPLPWVWWAWRLDPPTGMVWRCLRLCCTDLQPWAFFGNSCMIA